MTILLDAFPHVRKQVPAVVPTTGVLAVNTLTTSDGSQSVQVGYRFGSSPNGTTGFATVPPALGHGLAGHHLANFNRTDLAPVLGAVVPGGTLELNLFVDGDRVETFFGGAATLTTVTSNTVASSKLHSSFVNTAGLHCIVSSWVLAL